MYRIQHRVLASGCELCGSDRDEASDFPLHVIIDDGGGRSPDGFLEIDRSQSSLLAGNPFARVKTDLSRFGIDVAVI